MDLSNIKMIVSDMDGTLLNSKEQVSHLFFEQFNKLQELGIHFVAASGRQYNSIAQKLHPIKNLITIVGENGGVIKRENKTLLLQTFDPQKVVELIPALRNINNASIILCGEDTAFIESEDQNFISMFQEYYSAHEIVKDLTTIPHKTPIIKIALYHTVSSEQFIRLNQSFIPLSCHRSETGHQRRCLFRPGKSRPCAFHCICQSPTRRDI